MDKYVEQLIADIYAAQNWEEPKFKPEMERLDLFTEADSFFSEEKELFEQLFEITCGIKKAQFPAANLLTKQQMESLCEAIERLLFSWNLYTDLPDILPVDQAYKLLIGIFEQKIAIVSSGQTGIEFCNSTPKTCAFGKFCECKKIDDAIAIREKNLGATVLKIIAKIRNAPRNLPDPDIFALLYPEVNFIKEPVGPLMPVREWLELPADLFPTPDELTTEQTEAISDALLHFMNENICDWVASIPPKLRYISLIGYLNVKARYNGRDGLVLIFENSKKIKKLNSRWDDMNRKEES